MDLLLDRYDRANVESTTFYDHTDESVYGGSTSPMSTGLVSQC